MDLMGTYFRISGTSPQGGGMQKRKSLRTYVNLCAGEDHYLELNCFFPGFSADQTQSSGALARCLYWQGQGRRGTPAILQTLSVS